MKLRWPTTVVVLVVNTCVVCAAAQTAARLHVFQEIAESYNETDMLSPPSIRHFFTNILSSFQCSLNRTTPSDSVNSGHSCGAALVSVCGKQPDTGTLTLLCLSVFLLSLISVFHSVVLSFCHYFFLSSFLFSLFFFALLSLTFFFNLLLRVSCFLNTRVLCNAV